MDSESGTTATQEELGRTLGVPTVSLRKALRRPLLRNASGARQLLNRLTIDYVHFTRAGHELASELLTRAIVAAARQPLNSTEKGAERVQTLPVVAAPPTTCAFGDDLRPLVLRSGGWDYTVDVSKRGQPKPGLVATRPGATLDLFAEHLTLTLNPNPEPEPEPEPLILNLILVTRGLCEQMLRARDPCAEHLVTRLLDSTPGARQGACAIDR